MKPKFIPVEESFKQWKKNPRYVAAYNALEGEFALASAMIKARADADMTQEQVAVRMGVSIARVSQIESGDVSTQEVLNRFITALGGTLKLIADFGDEQLKIA